LIFRNSQLHVYCWDKVVEIVNHNDKAVIIGDVGSVRTGAIPCMGRFHQEVGACLAVIGKDWSQFVTGSENCVLANTPWPQGIPWADPTMQMPPLS